jgi:suppressor for copper-sensitivity B
VVAVAMLAAVTGATFVDVEPTRGGPPASSAIPWHSMTELDALVRSGRTVFVDITADWCVTCKVNEALVIGDDDIRRRLSTDVVAVRGDWTRPDPRIADYLNAFGRYGLPFNIVFGPNAPDGIVLPELLTRHAVLAAFSRSVTDAQHPTSRK